MNAKISDKMCLTNYIAEREKGTETREQKRPPKTLGPITGGVGHSAQWLMGRKIKMASFATDL